MVRNFISSDKVGRRDYIRSRNTGVKVGDVVQIWTLEITWGHGDEDELLSVLEVFDFWTGRRTKGRDRRRVLYENLDIRNHWLNS